MEIHLQSLLCRIKIQNGRIITNPHKINIVFILDKSIEHQRKLLFNIPFITRNCNFR